MCFLKAWIDFQKHTKSFDIFLQIKYQPNINQRRWYDMRNEEAIATFTEIRHLVEELITFLSIFGPQELGTLTARLNKSLSISTSIQWEGISVLKHAQSLHSYCENNSFWKTLWWDMWAMMHASKVSWIGIIVFCNRMEDMPLYHIFKLIILLFGFIMMFDTSMFLLSLTQTGHRLHWLKTLGLMLCSLDTRPSFIYWQIEPRVFLA